MPMFWFELLSVVHKRMHNWARPGHRVQGQVVEIHTHPLSTPETTPPNVQPTRGTHHRRQPIKVQRRPRWMQMPTVGRRSNTSFGPPWFHAHLERIYQVALPSFPWTLGSALPSGFSLGFRNVSERLTTVLHTPPSWARVLSLKPRHTPHLNLRNRGDEKEVATPATSSFPRGASTHSLCPAPLIVWTLAASWKHSFSSGMARY
ncbi:hypothetical protein CC79DRAFT_484002 [Sarocladium strictum]